MGAETESPVILSTSNGGASWESQDASSAGSVAKLTSVSFADSTNGWAAGISVTNDTQAPVILMTHDGGATWRVQDTQSVVSGWTPYSISFFDTKHGWAVGNVDGQDAGGPVILATNNGGVIWEAQDSGSVDSGASLVSVSAIDAAHCWVVGGTGISDGGLLMPVILATAQ